MIFVGVAGPSGSGKTTLCNLFREEGYSVHELDKIAKNYHPLAAKQISKRFGPEVMNNDGSINTRELGKTVFADRTKMDQLNAIMIPIINKEWFIPTCVDAWQTFSGIDRGITVFDVPILYETNWVEAMDYVVFVDANKKTRIQRLIDGRRIPTEIAEIQAGIFNYEKVFLRKQDIKIDTTNGFSEMDKLKLWMKEILKPEYGEYSNERYTGWTNLAL